MWSFLRPASSSLTLGLEFVTLQQLSRRSIRWSASQRDSLTVLSARIRGKASSEYKPGPHRKLIGTFRRVYILFWAARPFFVDEMALSLICMPALIRNSRFFVYPGLLISIQVSTRSIDFTLRHMTLLVKLIIASQSTTCYSVPKADRFFPTSPCIFCCSRVHLFLECFRSSTACSTLSFPPPVLTQQLF